MTSVDLAEFHAAAGGAPVRCPVALLLPTLEPDEATRLRAALVTPKEDIQHAAISRVVTRWGYTLTADAVKRHRNGECRCG